MSQAKALDTPEALKVSLDKELYAVGDKARVHLETRFNGIALVMVVDDRLIATKSVEVTGNAADIDLDVTRAVGSRRLCDRRPLPADGHRGEAHARPRHRARLGRRRSGRPRPRTSRSTRRTRCARARRWRSALTLANLPPDTRGLRHARRRRSRHPEPDPLRDARSGGLLFRPAPARRLDPRPLQPADRPHAGRARRGAHRRRRGRAAARQRRRRPRRWSPSIPASSKVGPDGDGACLRAGPRLQRHAPPDGAGLVDGRASAMPRRTCSSAIRWW